RLAVIAGSSRYTDQCRATVPSGAGLLMSVPAFTKAFTVCWSPAFAASGNRASRPAAPIEAAASATGIHRIERRGHGIERPLPNGSAGIVTIMHLRRLHQRNTRIVRRSHLYGIMRKPLPYPCRDEGVDLAHARCHLNTVSIRRTRAGSDRGSYAMG